MKLSLSQIRLAYLSLAAIANDPFEPITAYRIQKNLRVLEPEFQAYEKQRTALVKKHGDKTVDASKQEMWNVPQGTKKWDSFQKELAPLLDEVLEITIIPIHYSAFKTISPTMIGSIEFMLEGLEDQSNKQVEKPKPPRKRK